MPAVPCSLSPGPGVPYCGLPLDREHLGHLVSAILLACLLVYAAIQTYSVVKVLGVSCPPFVRLFRSDACIICVSINIATKFVTAKKVSKLG